MDATPRVSTVHEHGDDPLDVALCTEVGAILSAHYPGWVWGVEVPPGQNVLIIRNLTCDPHGRYCFMRHKDKLNMGQLRLEICRAAGAFLERYERLKGHWGPFRPEDISYAESIFAKPEQ